ncbi:Protease PrtS [Paramyrothecium foliicola]|nr:Protease PrtS [Paramyrothecium foliicola]
MQHPEIAPVTRCGESIALSRRTHGLRTIQGIVPPHLLQGIAESAHNSDNIRRAARASLQARDSIVAARRESAATAFGSHRRTQTTASNSGIVPPHLLRHVSKSQEVDDSNRGSAQHTLKHVEEHATKPAPSDQKKHDPKEPKTAKREVYDAHNSSVEAELPGELVRADGEHASKDKSVNEAYDNVGAVLKFYKEHFGWKSIDNTNAKVISTVHFGEKYENAFWDPERLQMVFGDGDEFLNNFTGCIDVIGHELTHAVTEHTSPLDYWGQPGALNEHVSDVFGIMIKQKIQDEKSEVADWLIGEDCILPGVKGVALRSMKEPGTAYDDPRFGKDPQPAHMSGYRTTFEDNGGVHIYSGIPNKAFYLASIAFGGYSWEKAGQIWWKALNSGKVPSKCTFVQFADATIETAEEMGDEEAKIIQQAWNDVGVTRKI